MRCIPRPSDGLADCLAVPRAIFLALLFGATLMVWLDDAWAVLLNEAALFGLGSCLALSGRLRFGPGVGVPLVFVAIAGMGALQLTANGSSPHETAQGSLFWLALAVAAVLTQSLWPMERAGPFLRMSAGAAALFSSVAALQNFTSAGRYFWLWPSGLPQVFGPFRSRNNFASFVLLFLPLCVAEALSESRTGRWLWLSAAALMAGAVLASGSRAGSALVLAELLTLLLTLQRTGQGRRRFFVLLTGALAALVVMGWNTLALKLADRDPLRHRRDMMASALTMATARPLTGFGLRTFPLVYPSFARFDSGHFVNHAHNEWLEFAAEAGIAGWALLPGATIAFLFRKRTHAATLGLIAVCVHALVDYPFQRLGLAVWVAAVASAVAVASSSRNSD